MYDSNMGLVLRYIPHGDGFPGLLRSLLLSRAADDRQFRVEKGNPEDSFRPVRSNTRRDCAPMNSRENG